MAGAWGEDGKVRDGRRASFQRDRQFFCDEPSYRGYGEANLEFIARHLPFFERQRAAGMKMPPVGDGSLSPIAFHFELGSLWHSGLAPLVMDRRTATGDTTFDPYLRRLDRFLEKNPRFGWEGQG